MELFGGAEVQSGNSFTALLELSPNQATELLHTAGAGDEFSPANLTENVQSRQWIVNQIPYTHTLNCSLPFPSNTSLIERAAKYSVFATGGAATSCFGGSGRYVNEMKSEPVDSDSNPNLDSLVSDPTVMCQIKKTAKRKEREMKGKGSVKGSKSIVNEDSGDGEKLPYIHVRARRGQATDSHSLAERARREKINARMKILQELVPGCNKISSTALVLDQIIKHVQNLQCQVEYLSMKVAEVNSRTDFNLDSLLAARNGSLMGDNFQSMMMPLSWPEFQMNGGGELVQEQWTHESLIQRDWVGKEDQCNLLTPENSLLSYDSGNSASMHPSQQRLEPGNTS
ncbi:hypothetical protein V2J09_023950 [Rumex salicifolius]